MQTSTASGIINQIEETVIALLLGTMTLVTFGQVFNRYVLNGSWVWALELVTYSFAWLVLFGTSYCLKRSAHLGVDAFVKLFPLPAQRLFGLAAVTAGLVYAGLLLSGSWTYVGKLYMIGIESEDLPIPQWLPMTVLLIGMVLLIIRLLQVGVAIYRGEQMTMLADEAKAAIDELRDDIAGRAER